MLYLHPTDAHSMPRDALVSTHSQSDLGVDRIFTQSDLIFDLPDRVNSSRVSVTKCNPLRDPVSLSILSLGAGVGGNHAPTSSR